ncbi:hypothetical protein AJ80_08755 [Polytolypa hystricis UAMH7299]|uniref:Uncharacterized protein n=1 Tax=Polytolypa hystricis (strain UAMH7299) TaxID=1447883 RepID=A0A2B7X2J1_POLH7|nr:hypothetical protein AJ80_08755 [Polytolypa hystricis UAMH7299]
MVAGNPTVTNTRALPYIEAHFDRPKFEGRLKETEFRLKKIENELRSTERRVSDLEESVSDLKDVRNRFISTYKRDILSNDTETDRVIIRSGNRFVHGGDCKRNAELYEAPARRRDFDIYIKLYGLHPGIVRSSISYRPTIELLDRHATAVSDQKIKLPTNFNDLFVQFIRALETSNFDEDYLINPTSSVTVAYWAFLRHCPV